MNLMMMTELMAVMETVMMIELVGFMVVYVVLHCQRTPFIVLCFVGLVLFVWNMLIKLG